MTNASAPPARRNQPGDRAGEIVGIAGVDGNGQTELSEAIAGCRMCSRRRRHRRQGRDGHQPHERRARGVGSSRRTAGSRTLRRDDNRENVSADNYAARKLTSYGLIAWRARRLRRRENPPVRHSRRRPALPSLNYRAAICRRCDRARDGEGAKCARRRPADAGLDIGAEFVHGQILAAADAVAPSCSSHPNCRRFSRCRIASQ